MKVKEIQELKCLKNARMRIGLVNELHYDEDIKECFEDFGDIQHTKDDTNYFDWENENAIWELKTRFVKQKQYPDTIIGYDKIEYALKELEKGKQVFCLFAFLDTGLTYWELTKEKLEKMKIDVNGCYIRMNRKKHLHIPTDELINLSEKLPITSAEYDKHKTLYDYNRKSI